MKALTGPLHIFTVRLRVCSHKMSLQITVVYQRTSILMNRCISDVCYQGAEAGGEAWLAESTGSSLMRETVKIYF